MPILLMTLWSILRHGAALQPDGWVYWQGSVSLALDGTYRDLWSRPITWWPPGFSAYLMIVQAIAGWSPFGLAAASALLTIVGWFTWSTWLMRIQGPISRRETLTSDLVRLATFALLSVQLVRWSNSLLANVAVWALLPVSLLSSNAVVVSVTLAAMCLLHNTSILFVVSCVIFGVWGGLRRSLLIAIPSVATTIVLRLVFQGSHQLRGIASIAERVGGETTAFLRSIFTFLGPERFTPLPFQAVIGAAILLLALIVIVRRIERPTRNQLLAVLLFEAGVFAAIVGTKLNATTEEVRFFLPLHLICWTMLPIAGSWLSGNRNASSAWKWCGFALIAFALTAAGLRTTSFLHANFNRPAQAATWPPSLAEIGTVFELDSSSPRAAEANALFDASVNARRILVPFPTWTVDQ